MRHRGWVVVGALACLVGVGCQDSGDGDQPASCSECACEDYCVALCQRVDDECGGTRVRNCTEGCFALEPDVCPVGSVPVRECALLAQEAECYEVVGSGDGDCFRSGLPPGLCRGDGSALECGLNAHCNAATSMCEPGCLDDVACPTGFYCDTDEMDCAAGCSDDLDCEGEDVCNLETHACESQPCEQPTDCPFMLTCNPASQRCEPCGADNCEGQCDAFGRCVECLETTDCPATHECRSNVCRQRCNANVPCAAGSVCYLDLCSDPVGAPCDPDNSSTCFGGRCLDEDASLMTVEPYCAPMCTLVTAPTPGFLCPDGYQCMGFDCVRQ